MQIVTNKDNLHEMPNPVFWKNKKSIIAICCLLFNCPESAKHQFSADNILKYFFLFFPDTRFDISCKLSPICMKYQILFSGLFEPKVILYFDGTCFLLG